MCLVCGFPICVCPTVKMPPCEPCTEDNGCMFTLPASCITINSITLDGFLECNTFLDYIYDCLVENPDQLTKFCELWANCNLVCGAPQNLTVIANTEELDSAIVSWTEVSGVTYEIYLDDVLQQAGATSPYTLHALTAGQVYVVKVIAICENEVETPSTTTFSLCPAATNFALNLGLSTANSALVQWTMVSGAVYDLYLDGVLKQVAATTPYAYTGLVPDVLYTAKIVTRCAGGLSTSFEITFTLN